MWSMSSPGEHGEPGLPRLPGFREMALRRMAAGRRRLVGELTAQRQAAGLSQTQVAARMGTSQSAVARLEAGEADVRASTLERYAAAIGSQIGWRLEDTPPLGAAAAGGTGVRPGARSRGRPWARAAILAGSFRLTRAAPGPRPARSRRTAPAVRTTTGGPP